MNDKFLFTGKIPGQGMFGFGYVDDDSMDNDPRFSQCTPEQKEIIKQKMKELAEKLMAKGQPSIQDVMQANKEMENFTQRLIEKK